VWQAVVAVRINRDPATMSELYDARNARQRTRTARLSPDEERRHLRNYLRREAPDMIAKLGL
jgi:hypothetical protein